MQNPNANQIAAFEAFIRERLPLSSDLLSEVLVWVRDNLAPEYVFNDTDLEYWN